jgi:low molecular weight protein-tyrosine phosphatase
MAEVVLRAALVAAGLDTRVAVDSAGTGDWHVGDPMNLDARAQLARRGYDGSAHRARQFSDSWFAERDVVLAMDASNLANLRVLAGDDTRPRIRLFGEVAGLGAVDVPDPYGEDQAEFARVLDMLESAMPRVVQQIAAALDKPASLNV